MAGTQGKTIVKLFCPYATGLLRMCSAQSLVDGLLDAGADVEAGQFVIPGMRENAVGKKDVHQPVIRVNPCASARETRMPIYRRRRLLAARTAAGIAAIGFVKAKAAAAGARQGGGKYPASFRTKVAMPAQGASVQQHLVEQSLLVGVGEKSCIARHSAKESRRLVVDKALEDEGMTV